VIVAEYFDIGLTRALPWYRRPHVDVRRFHQG
jgi:hypothetical protein